MLDETDSGLDIGYLDIPTTAGSSSTLHFTFLKIDVAVPDDTVYQVELTA